jgi:hypothetical protein
MKAPFIDRYQSGLARSFGPHKLIATLPDDRQDQHQRNETPTNDQGLRADVTLLINAFPIFGQFTKARHYWASFFCG